MSRHRLVIIALFMLLAAVACWWRYCQWRDHRFDMVVLSAAHRYGVEPALVKAVIWRESWFNPDARGSKQEFGLMQIRVAAAGGWAQAGRLSGFTPEHLFDPTTNTLAGAWYLAKLLRRYRQTDNPLPYALADYNAGRTRVLRWASGMAATNSAAFIQQIGFPATREYVRTVMRRSERYHQEFAARAE